MDIAIFYWINHLPHFVWIDKIMVLIDSIVTPLRLHWYLLVLLVIGLLLRRKKLWEGSLFLFLALLSTWQINLFLKNWAARPRPFSVLENVHAIGIRSTSSSFPATLAMNAALIGTFMILFTGRIKPCWIGLILSAGIFRIYCGVHYPSDILGGWGMGVLLGWFSYRALVIFEKVINSSKKERI